MGLPRILTHPVPGPFGIVGSPHGSIIYTAGPALLIRECATLQAEATISNSSPGASFSCVTLNVGGRYIASGEADGKKAGHGMEQVLFLNSIALLHMQYDS